MLNLKPVRVLLLTIILLQGTAWVHAQPRARMVSPEVHADRSVTFRLRAPEASKVEIRGEFPQGRKALAKDEQGQWSVKIGPIEPGIHAYSFHIDGVQGIDPANPNIKIALRPNQSLLEIPGDAPMYYEEQNVPHGTVHMHRYYSKTLEQKRGVYVYTPPEYRQKSNQEYPVLYLLHGMGDTEQGWTVVGRAHLIADNLLAKKKARPMIIVMPFGHAPRQGRGGGATGFEDDLLDEVMPLIESSYRVSKNAGSRALAGLSMGGFQTIDIGVKHMDKFNWLGVFSAGVRPDYEKTHGEYLDQANDKLKLLWIGIGNKDFLFRSNENLLNLLKKKKVKHISRITDGGHEWRLWRQYLNELLPLLFQ